MSIDRSISIFGNAIDDRTYRKACAAKRKFARKFNDDPTAQCHVHPEPLPVIGERLGVRNLVSGSSSSLDLAQDAQNAASLNDDALASETTGKPVIVGNIRMGFGHYRISMAMASAAHALGHVPYWFDLSSFPDTTCSKVIGHQNDLYSMGSRLSQRSRLFNKLYWEPLNSEGFKKLSYNATNQKVAELMCAPFADLDRDTPFIAAHVWPAQAALHAGMKRVVNAIPDNWPMALHLAEGSIHTVQTPNSYLGYKALRGMDAKRSLKPMPDDSLVYTGHYVDHELVLNIQNDCAARMARLDSGKPVRYLLSVGGAGAQMNLFKGIIEHLLSKIEAGRATLFVNVGDHLNVWEGLRAALPALNDAHLHFDDFDEVAAFAQHALAEDAQEPVEGVHAFFHQDIFAAVYSTNLLMRVCDILVTKPSELSFYPVPKMMIQRVGGHEAWGAIRSAEVGDGTYELETLPETCAMIDMIQAEPGIIAAMCDNIMAADALGVYDGAYRVVNLAIEGVAAQG